MNNERMSYDVIVVGGGPGGSTAACALAKRGRRVLVLEREHFPRYHVGESVIPFLYQILHRIDALEKVEAAGFQVKSGFQFLSPRGKLTRPIYFNDSIRDARSATWHVDRAQYDQLLLEHAAELGVTVRHGATVSELLRDGDRVVGVRYRDEDGTSHEVRASFVIDASGRATFVSRKLGLRERDPVLDQLAIWRYLEGGFRQAHRDEGNIILALLEPKGWFWWFPRSDGTVSVGVVSSASDLKRRGTTLQEQFERCLQHNPRLVEWASTGKWVGEYRCTGDYSYTSTRFAGEGWALVGDAGAFIDPVFSSGIWLAQATGWMAAEAIADGLDRGDRSAAVLADYEVLFRRAEGVFRIFLDTFYDENFSAGRFLRDHPDLIPEWGRILQGDVFDDNRSFCEYLMEYRRGLAAQAGRPAAIHVPDGWAEELAADGDARVSSPIVPYRDRLEPIELAAE
ncbi:MAG: NAD(P)/FAD-dependent oxidoreductase [Nannocystaceae bacterium]